MVSLNCKIIQIILMGFSSGLPYLLILSTLNVWLKESGANQTIIGQFSLVTIPYAFKFIWGPIVDRCAIPGLTAWLGQRRGWGLMTQLCLAVAIIGLGCSDPSQNKLLTAFAAFCVGLCAACQDAVLEAYRIEITEPENKGVFASASYFGFRLGMMASGAGVLYLAAFGSWRMAYSLMSLCILIGMIALFLSPEPACLTRPAFKEFLAIENLKKSFLIQAIKDFQKRYDWPIVIIFIFFYKVGDTTLNLMNIPFLIDLGFKKIEIARIAKLFGITTMIVGGVVGGALIQRFGVLLGLILCAILHIVSCLVFVIQALIGHHIYVLIISIGIENFTCGLGATAYVAYLTQLCVAPYTATHNALLTSIGSMARICLSMMAGWLADQLPWPWFFLSIAFLCCPLLILLLNSPKHFQDSRFCKTRLI